MGGKSYSVRIDKAKENYYNLAEQRLVAKIIDPAELVMASCRVQPIALTVKPSIKLLFSHSMWPLC